MKPSTNPNEKHGNPKPSIKQSREYAGPAFLSGAFRPFFLAASIWAAAAIGMWLLSLSGAPAMPSGVSSTAWHSHEMIFGFGGAALAGFILTAIPNWTGRLPVRGAALAGLALLWLLGRLSLFATAFFGMPWVSLLDLLFPIALFLVVLREIIAGKSKRNLPVAILFGVLASANILYHAESFGIAGLFGHGWRLGLGAIVLLISVIGGRIVPSFTRNWLVNVKGERKRLPAAPSALDKYILIMTATALLIWTIFPDIMLSGILLILAGIGQLIRLSRWRGLSAMGETIVYVLHIGYFWIGFGLLFLGVSILWGALAPSDAIHALTVGGVGTMIAAVMSRASLGHAGKPIKAGQGLSLVYVLISLAVIARIASGLFPELYLPLVNFSGGLWVIAFALFAALFLPLYFKPRAE